MERQQLSVTHSLIIICVVVYIVGLFRQVPIAPGVYEPFLTQLGYFSWETCFVQGELWRIITYQFLHANIGHLVFNMWALFFFGPHIEYIMGPKRFLAFYLVCGVAGALFSALLGHWMYGAVWPFIGMVGASASIYGVMIATAFLYPDARISLLFPPVTLTMRSFALIILGIATVVILSSGHNAGGEAGHLGGAIMGFIIMIIWKWRNRHTDY
ncbi:MAG: rhomboid family intramembrane serine protease [Akkermansia sp.]|nr:rhomboid family intramembrane serine protease [Akkermansia sp.]